MRYFRTLRRQFFDIRPGEHWRTWSMFAYLLLVLFAYYILKPVSRAMFLNRFDLDRLPALYILIAACGGILAYLYSKLAARTSLSAAVLWAMGLSVACLVVMWALIRMHLPWMIYVLNVWVSLFAVVLVSQGWLVAGNIFNPREAKRLYGLLGMGMVLGAALGGEFTSRTAALVGTENLLLASAFMVMLAYGAFRVATSPVAGQVSSARGADDDETDFSFSDVARDIVRTRHLQVLIGIMIVTFIVDVLVEYQFQATAKGAFRGDQLTAFFGRFYGLYLNTAEFVFQLFLTGAVVNWLGVGGTMQIMPVSILFCSAGTVAAPGVASASAVRLTEATTRYTLNRTGMELLYLPLPNELRNRIKAFIDIFVDRMARGAGGVLLVLLTATSLDLQVRHIAMVVMALTIPWMFLAWVAKREYVATVRGRLESRRFDLESARITVRDAATIRLLEETAAVPNPRQAAYALSLLAEAPGYDLGPVLRGATARPEPEVRAKAYDLARRQRMPGLEDAARRDLEAPGVARPAAAYLAATASDPRALVHEWLEGGAPESVEGALDHLANDRGAAEDLITPDWLRRAATDRDPRRRQLAACAVAVRGDQGTEVLHRLLTDSDPSVASAACRTAGMLRTRSYVDALVNYLGVPRVRGAAIEALAEYGAALAGTLSDLLLDERIDARIRRQVPRVLKLIPHQRAVDVLLTSIGHNDLSTRSAVLRALTRLRETAPQLNYENSFVTERIAAEVRYYFEINAALAPLRESGDQALRASRLLARTLEERLRQTLERLFRLLGLRYPPKEIYSAYLAVSRDNEHSAAALEFLDNVLERNLKRLLLPLLDAPDHVLERGRDLYGLDLPTAEDAVRSLIRSGDPWLTACAVAAAAEMKMRALAPDIARAAETAPADVLEVARSAQQALAA
jgi:ATP/ADP translocase